MDWTAAQVDKSIGAATKEIESGNLCDRNNDGKLWALIYHCIHCKFILIGAHSDSCTNCNSEIHPVQRWVQMGVSVDPNSMRGS